MLTEKDKKIIDEFVAAQIEIIKNLLNRGENVSAIKEHLYDDASYAIILQYKPEIRAYIDQCIDKSVN